MLILFKAFLRSKGVDFRYLTFTHTEYQAVLKFSSSQVGFDQLISIQDFQPLASFKAAANSRYVSVKQGELTRRY